MHVYPPPEPSPPAVREFIERSRLECAEDIAYATATGRAAHAPPRQLAESFFNVTRWTRFREGPLRRLRNPNYSPARYSCPRGERGDHGRRRSGFHRRCVHDGDIRSQSQNRSQTFLDPAVALCLQSTNGRGFPEAKRRPALVSPGVLSGADHRGRFRISASQRVRIRALALRRRGGGSRSFPNYIEEIYAARDHFGTFR